MSGAAGEEFGNASYRFKVTNVAEVSSYRRKYTNGIAVGGDVTSDANTNEKLIVVDCTLTNATTSREEFCFSRDRTRKTRCYSTRTGVSAPAAIDVAADELNPPARSRSRARTSASPSSSASRKRGNRKPCLHNRQIPRTRPEKRHRRPGESLS
jgi:hypothetical protein